MQNYLQKRFDVIGQSENPNEVYDALIEKNIQIRTFLCKLMNYILNTVKIITKYFRYFPICIMANMIKMVDIS